MSPQRLSFLVLFSLLCVLFGSTFSTDAKRTPSSVTPTQLTPASGYQAKFDFLQSSNTMAWLNSQMPQSSPHSWQDLGEPDAGFTARRRASGLRRYRALVLDVASLRTSLRGAPSELAQSFQDKRPIISLPLSDGSFGRFAFEEAPILEQPLGKKFPGIKTYRGYGVDDLTATTRFDLTPLGFHAIIISTHGTTLIEPDQPGTGSEYLAYSQDEIPPGTIECDVDSQSQEIANQRLRRLAATNTPVPNVSSGSMLRTYRLAVAATAEYTNTYGSGSVNLALAAVTTTVNLVNAIYERELSIRLVLVANEDQLIFTDTTTDGYTHDNVNALISENPGRINAIIGSSAYDIGHVFDGRTSTNFSWQGVASLASVCSATAKARGVSITRNVSPSNLYAYYSTAHEIGHQFGASHTFNATTGFCGGQRASSTAYEPGTGSTIMGYRLNCGSEDLNSMDTYFHHASLEQIVAFVSGPGSCATTTPTGNNIPTIDAGSTYTIPRDTPFALTAIGSDVDGDPLTYGWEQYDLGNPGPPNSDDGTRPIMRSYTPTTDPTRVFPRGANSGANAVFFDELASTTRTLNFRVTARDNRGAINSSATQINVRADAGEFNVIEMSGQAGSVTTVAWNVRGTDQPPVSCSSVKISLSIDNGQTYPIVLAANTPNDGREDVTLPFLQSPIARVKVEAVGNVFFDVTREFLISGTSNPSPTIAWFSPSTTTAGNSVRINGLNLISPSSVRFNGIEASFTVNSTTEIIATVPQGNTTGPITVTTPYGTATSSSTFGTPPQYFVEGSITDETSNLPVAGVTVNLEMVYQGVTTNGTAVTDANGNYKSANVGCQTSIKVTPFKFGFSFNPVDTTLTYPFCVSGKGTADFKSHEAGPSTIRLASETFDTNEFQGNIQVTIVRSGATSGFAGVDYATSDTDTFTIPCNERVNNMGAAYARCDYAVSRDTVIFQPGQTSRTITIPVVNDAYAEGLERFSISLSNAAGATLGTPSTSTLLIFDNDTVDGSNPIFTTPFFVRLHYLDFLSREPEPGEPWSGVLNGCSDVNNNPACDRLTVSASFFGSPEFQLKGYFVFRFYKLAFNRLPTYSEIVVDMRSVTGLTPNEVFQKKAQFTNAFVLRSEFINAYGGLSNAQYVTMLMNRYGLTQVTTPDPAAPDGTNKVTLTTADLANQLNAATLTRAQVLRAIADSDQVFSVEFNPAFVAIQYYGYLRRTPESTGYQNWLNFLNANPTNFRAMVDGFMNSLEYRLRFGP